MDDVKFPDLSLPQDLADEIDSAVKAGEYASPDAVIREAVGEWKERRDNHGYTVAELRKLIQEGDDSGSSHFDSFDDLKAEAHRRFDNRLLP